MHRMTTSKKKTSAKTAAGDGTTSLEARLLKTPNCLKPGLARWRRSIASKPSSAAFRSSSSSPIWIHFREEISPLRLSGGSTHQPARVIISDQAPPEPPSMRTSRSGAGPSFTLT